ncbi:hypothetical protein G4Y79_08930 [Phototrophicus methaneseepsis]|uniref:Uncharacterized protein n=1 Tax=Phototrophicus methaneseepsis TaxID=2710758 RepID=A0A7S8ECL0_9CHLR|nr:hypothetical protein [Phototrophicus methaneseepsis]QPC84482.1 hypothetical protein G4Y79_08930 [Phototrophicus methaneseepsis]
MASKKQDKRFDIKQAFLIAYLGLGVLMVAATLALAFTDNPVATIQPTLTSVPTLPPMVLTQQAEGYQPYDEQADVTVEGSVEGTVVPTEATVQVTTEDHDDVNIETPTEPEATERS